MRLKAVAIVLFFAFQHSYGQVQKECIPRSYGLSSFVCVCNSTYCDTIPRPCPLPEGKYVSYTSTQAGLRFKIEEGKFQPIANETNYTIINIDASKKYQSIIGWGGAFTDASGINIKSLSSGAANNLMRSFFSEDGLEYNLCRVPVAGTDFSTRPYSYDDGDSDPELLNFKLAPEDYEYKISLIKEAQNLTKGKLELFASAWGPPVWMKTNGQVGGPGFLKPEMYQPWANYFVKFLKAYREEGLEFWGITTGNEPLTGLLPIALNSVGWVPADMRNWIENNLGPTIRSSEFSSIKLLAIDDQIVNYPGIIDLLFLSEKVKGYIDGFGLHWYLNEYLSHELLSKTHNEYPNKFILATEACEGSYPFRKVHVLMGEWGRLVTYATDIIGDLNNWVTGWIDWNMALNEIGGPTYINNEVDAVIIVNATSDEFYKQPMFYALGHFSKFIPKGSQRISVTQSNNTLGLVAFRRPDNGTAVVILNTNSFDVPVKLRQGTKQEISRSIAANSLTTLLYW